MITAVAFGVFFGFVVCRGMTFIGDALAHAILRGIAVALIFGINLLAGTLGAAVL